MLFWLCIKQESWYYSCTVKPLIYNVRDPRKLYNILAENYLYILALFFFYLFIFIYLISYLIIIFVICIKILYPDRKKHTLSWPVFL